MHENYRDLSEIVAAMAKGDAGVARSLIRTHVRKFNNNMKDVEQQSNIEALNLKPQYNQ